MFDSCGMAGGHKPPNGGFGGIYVNTTHAKLGDRGSEVLPAMKTGTVWKAGSVVEVAWTIGMFSFSFFFLSSIGVDLLHSLHVASGQS